MKSLRLQYDIQHLGTWPEASDDLPPPGQITVCPPPVPLNLPTFVFKFHLSWGGLPLARPLARSLRCTHLYLAACYRTGHLPACLPACSSSPPAHKASTVRHLNQMVMGTHPPPPQYRQQYQWWGGTANFSDGEIHEGVHDLYYSNFSTDSTCPSSNIMYHGYDMVTIF